MEVLHHVTRNLLQPRRSSRRAPVALSVVGTEADTRQSLPPRSEERPGELIRAAGSALDRSRDAVLSSSSRIADEATIETTVRLPSYSFNPGG